jgi:hypothetical protein
MVPGEALQTGEAMYFRRCDRCLAEASESAGFMPAVIFEGLAGYRQRLELCPTCRADRERFWPNVSWTYQDAPSSFVGSP